MVAILTQKSTAHNDNFAQDQWLVFPTAGHTFDFQFSDDASACNSDCPSTDWRRIVQWT